LTTFLKKLALFKLYKLSVEYVAFNRLPLPVTFKYLYFISLASKVFFSIWQLIQPYDKRQQKKYVQGCASDGKDLAVAHKSGGADFTLIIKKM
jgi:hypothetical protein